MGQKATWIVVPSWRRQNWTSRRRAAHSAGVLSISYARVKQLAEHPPSLGDQVQISSQLQFGLELLLIVRGKVILVGDLGLAEKAGLRGRIRRGYLLVVISCESAWSADNQDFNLRETLFCEGTTIC